jgi:hypothetical protein
MKKKGPKKIKIVTEQDRLKMEIARELGIWDKIEADGWESLTNAQCGRVGGIMHQKLKLLRQGQGQSTAQS